MYAAAAAANLELDVMGNSSSRFDIELVGAGATNTTALYSGIYQTSCGVRVSLGEALSGLELAVDANVWRRVGNDIYVGLDRPVRIYEAEAGAEETPHLARVNLPAMLSVHEGGGLRALRHGRHDAGGDLRAGHDGVRRLDGRARARRRHRVHQIFLDPRLDTDKLRITARPGFACAAEFTETQSLPRCEGEVDARKRGRRGGINLYSFGRCAKSHHPSAGFAGSSP